MNEPNGSDELTSVDCKLQKTAGVYGFRRYAIDVYVGRFLRLLLVTSSVAIISASFVGADQYSLAKQKAAAGVGSKTTLDKSVPAKMDTPVSDFNRKENMELKGKFQVFRVADNTLLIAVGQKFETIFLTKSTKLTRGDKTIQPDEIKEGEMLQAKVTKSQGKMTATDITVAGK